MTIPLITTPPSVADLVSIYNQLVRLINASGGGGGSGTVTTDGDLTADVLPKATAAAEIGDSNYEDHGDGVITIDIGPNAYTGSGLVATTTTVDDDPVNLAAGPAEDAKAFGQLVLWASDDNTPTIVTVASSGLWGSDDPVVNGTSVFALKGTGYTAEGNVPQVSGLNVIARSNFTDAVHAVSVELASAALDGTNDTRLVIDADGDTAIKNGVLTVESHAPAAANSTGKAGTITWEAGFLYVCVATNTWERVATATWP